MNIAFAERLILMNSMFHTKSHLAIGAINKAIVTDCCFYNTERILIHWSNFDHHYRKVRVFKPCMPTQMVLNI